MAENLLSEKMDLVELKMSDFFSSVEKAFIVSYQRGKQGEYRDRNLLELNRIFFPVLKGFDAISGVGLGDEIGNYYLLEQHDGLYENMILKLDSKINKPLIYEWTDYKGELDLISRDTLNVLFDPHLRPGIKELLNLRKRLFFGPSPINLYPVIIVVLQYQSVGEIEEEKST